MTRPSRSLWALALLALPLVARADKLAPPTPRPPELIEHVQAEYPADAKHEGIEGAVVLLITVDAAGLVADVKVKQPAGHGFDEAAVAAARRFRFRPARLGAKPVAVAVTYTYRFVIGAAPTSQPASGPTSQPASGPASRPASRPAAPAGAPVASSKPRAAVGREPVNLSGRVLERGTRAPLALVEASLPGVAGLRVESVFTDAQGRFAFRGVPAGEHRLRLARTGHRIAQTEVVVRRSERTEVKVYLERLAYDDYQLTVRGKRPKQEVTRHVLEREALQKIPGTHGDTIKVVEVLPGVARTPMGLGGLIVLRGADHDGSRAFLDGISLEYLFHFGGLRSVINSDLIDRLTLYPGNPGAYYDDTIGGVIDVRTRKPKTDRLHFKLDVNVYEAGLLVEGPITDNLSFFAAVHRNYHDIVLDAVLDDDAWSFSVAPRYYDYQAKLHWKISAAQSLELFWLGSDDEMRVVVGKDEEVGFNFGQHTYFHQMLAKHRWRLGPRLRNELTATVKFAGERGDFAAENHVEVTWLNVVLRDDLKWRLGRRCRLNAGLVGGAAYFDLNFTAPHFARMGEEDYGPGSELRSSVDTFAVPFVGAYAELVARPFERLKLIPGVRADYQHYNQSLNLGGNLTARLRLLEGTELKGAVGTFNRLPAGPMMSKGYGNPDLANERSYQYSVGVEQRLGERVRVDVTGFFSDMRNLVASNPRLNSDPSAVPYTNGGRGRSFGLELMIKHAPSKYFHGWLSYTLSRAERRFPDKAWELFALDQTHILNAVGMFRLPRNWSVGFRFHLVSGNPTDLYTERGGLNADSGTYLPVTGTIRSGRMPLVHSLDLRVDKTFVFDRWLWTVYLDVKNVYNRRNPEFLAWSYDYTQHEHITGLPILPSIGTKIEF